jgi:uncharacterized protein YprB with RNaseH-like and TPR domain
MPTISERLKSLGVHVGTSNLPAPKPLPRADHPIESVLAGEWQVTPHGEVFVVETRYRADFLRGTVKLRNSTPLEMIAAWAREPRLPQLPLEKFAFLDTETTGLAGGSGTYTFLVGLGRFEGETFRLAQFFLRDPAEELAQLSAIENFLAPCEAIVSFNGKSFDLPLLNARYITNGWPPPLKNTAHIDLLHLARRLWRSRLPSRTLGDLEAKILGATRTERDVPGWMVADLYFDYLHSGDARPLLGVFYHNEMDVVSLAALLNHMATLIEDPLSDHMEHGLDQIAIGKLYADLGYLDKAAEIYQHGLTHDDLQESDYAQALEQLSFIHKRRGDHKAALDLWEQAAQNGQIYAHIELAKVYEHKLQDYEEAIHWTENAIQQLHVSNLSSIELTHWLPELEHRLKRLQRKIENQKS